jgi:hypothetical protein
VSVLSAVLNIDVRAGKERSGDCAVHPRGPQRHARTQSAGVDVPSIEESVLPPNKPLEPASAAAALAAQGHRRWASQCLTRVPEAGSIQPVLVRHEEIMMRNGLVLFLCLVGAVVTAQTPAPPATGGAGHSAAVPHDRARQAWCDAKGVTLTELRAKAEAVKKSVTSSSDLSEAEKKTLLSEIDQEVDSVARLLSDGVSARALAKEASAQPPKPAAEARPGAPDPSGPGRDQDPATSAPKLSAIDEARVSLDQAKQERDQAKTKAIDALCKSLEEKIKAVRARQKGSEADNAAIVGELEKDLETCRGGERMPQSAEADRSASVAFAKADSQIRDRYRAAATKIAIDLKAKKEVAESEKILRDLDAEMPACVDLSDFVARMSDLSRKQDKASEGNRNSKNAPIKDICQDLHRLVDDAAKYRITASELRSQMIDVAARIRTPNRAKAFRPEVESLLQDTLVALEKLLPACKASSGS